jgi:hypothetical protein
VLRQIHTISALLGAPMMATCGQVQAQGGSASLDVVAGQVKEGNEGPRRARGKGRK